jgi:hypothetical protein
MDVLVVGAVVPAEHVTGVLSSSVLRHPNMATLARRRAAKIGLGKPLAVRQFASRGSWVRVPSSPPPTAQVRAHQQRGAPDPLTSRAGFVPLGSSAGRSGGTLAAVIVWVPPSNSWSDRRHTQRPSPSVLVPVHSGIDESVIKTSLHELFCLCVSPAVTGEASGAWLRSPFDCHQAAGWSQDTP